MFETILTVLWAGYEEKSGGYRQKRMPCLNQSSTFLNELIFSAMAQNIKN